MASIVSYCVWCSEIARCWDLECGAGQSEGRDDVILHDLAELLSGYLLYYCVYENEVPVGVDEGRLVGLLRLNGSSCLDEGVLGNHSLPILLAPEEGWIGKARTI